MRRRDFIGVLGVAAGASALRPMPLHGQQPERIRRIGVLMSLSEGDLEGQARIAAFLQGLRDLSWVDGRNVQIDVRWTAGNAERVRRYVAELDALAPDVILASGGTVVGTLLQASRTIPIVFTQTPDPVGAGFVASLAQPGGNATGFTQFEYGMSAKWLELLKEIAPLVTRAAVLRDPTIPEGVGQFAAMQAMAPSLGVELRPLDVRDVSEIERGLAASAIEPGGGLIVTSGSVAIARRELIIALAARHKLPAVFPADYFVSGGGLVSYGPDTIDPHRRAAGYVDRILKGEKPADLPVQAPTKHELALNLKTAKALGLTIPPALVGRADKVIE